MNINEVYHAYLKQKESERPRDEKVFHASSAGSCYRKQMYSINNFPSDEKDEKSLEELAEDIEEKAKDIEKEGSAADQFDDVMSDVFGVSRKDKDKSVLDINIGKVKGRLEELGVKDKSISEKIAKDMVGDYDDAVLGDDEIMSEIMNREDVKEQIKKDREDREPNAQGGMIDKPLYNRA